DARKGPGLQNCYIFHCPTSDDCPLTPSPGVRSYSIWSDSSSLRRLDSANKVQKKLKSSDRSRAPSSPEKTSNQNNKKPSPAIASQGSAKLYPKEEADDSPKRITTQLLHLTEELDQHLEELGSKPGAAGEDDLRVHRPSPTEAVVVVRTTTVK
ncbi:hypothetical protein GDO81_028400, partial [Engystomops pustulosus]